MLVETAPTPYEPLGLTHLATDGDQQRRGPSQRLVRQLPGHGVARYALTTAATTPPVGLDDPAGQHRTPRIEPLTSGFEAELIKSAERREVRAGEARLRGRVGRVEVFQMGSVRTPILGRPRPLPDRRRAVDLYTLNCEEP